MKKVLMSALVIGLGASVGLAQYVDPPVSDPPEVTSAAVDFDDGDLTWNYVGARSTTGATDVLYLETTQSGFFAPIRTQVSFGDDIHNRGPMSINEFSFAYVSRTSAGNVPVTATVSFYGNDPNGNVVGPIWGSVTVTGLQTGAFFTSVTTPSKIATNKDIWMRVQFSEDTASDTGQLIGADLNNPEGGTPGASHDWFLVFDNPSGAPLGLSFFGGYTPNLPTDPSPPYELPGNFLLGISGKEISPLQVTVVIKGPGPCAPFNRGSHGVLPVRMLDTIVAPGATISRTGFVGSVSSNEGPPGPSTNTSGNDSVIKFNTDQMVAALGLGSLADGDQVELCVTGILANDPLQPATGCDCVTMVPPGSSGPTELAVRSNLGGSWITMSPADDQTDTGGYGHFRRTYPVSTHVVLEAEEDYQGRRFVGWTFNGDFQSRYLITAVDVNGSNANGKKIDAVFRRAGDITGDDAVNLIDFAAFAVCFGQSWGSNGAGCSNEALASSDLDRNGVINLADFAIFAVNFGT